MQENRLFEALLDVIPFAAYAVDVDTYEVVYANKLCTESMYAPRDEYCWKKLYGQEEVCSWCKIAELKQRQKVYKNEKIIHDFFDESTDKWFQSYDELVKWPDGRTVKYSIAVDISDQKEIQANMIKTNTKLAIQTKKLKEANEKLELFAKKDHLTGINNRASFFSLGDELFAKALEDEKTLYVAMMDIDDLKNINDSFGHPMGDMVLKTFVQNIKSQISSDDIFARLEADGFALIFMDMDQSEVLNKLEQLKQGISKLDVEFENHKINFTISVAVDSLSSQDKKFDSILNRVEKSLSQAKSSGKN